MLQFWKKSGKQQNQIEHSSIEPEFKRTDYSCCKNEAHTFSLANYENEFLSSGAEPLREKSTLTTNLAEVLSDKNCLSYFEQFMESQNALAYILCWLDIDTFKSEILAKSLVFRDNSTLDQEHDSLSVSTDCESYTADSNSLCDCSSATISDSKTRSDCHDLTNVKCDKECSDISVSPKLNHSSITDHITTSDHEKVLSDHALAIFKKYIAQEAQLPIKCTEENRKSVIENICDSKGIVSLHSFEQIEHYVYNIMDKNYFESYLASDFFCKYQIDVLTKGDVVLEDILYNETALFYFMEFLEQENSRSLLEFWIAATNFHQQIKTQSEFFDPIEAQNDAVVLYDKYFSLQAQCALGFSDKIRFIVEQNICGENGIILDCFNLPLKIVEYFLDQNHLKTFLSSQLFYKFLSDLINTVQSNGYSTNIRRHKRTSSNASSEKSFASSTFLAMEINQNMSKNYNKSNMSIDTRELYDPDALWKRKRSHRLSCGRITALGKYETDFEPEPDKKEFSLKSVVKKIVSLDDEEKRKEEMAWQVAEMIVRDITSVTLNEPAINDFSDT